MNEEKSAEEERTVLEEATVNLKNIIHVLQFQFGPGYVTYMFGF